MLLVACTQAWALEFGTLFHTAQERARLDRLRRGESAVATAERPAPPPELTGYVERSDGRHTLWINGTPVPATGPKAQPLLDPRKVRDDRARLPESAIRASR